MENPICPICGHPHEQGTPCPECNCGHEHATGTECHEPGWACGHNRP